MPQEHRIVDCACFNTRRAARLVGQLYDRALGPSGLTNTQFSLLAMAVGRGPMSITALARELGMDRSTLSRNIGLLERRGLVGTSRGGGRDARTRTVDVTDAGREMLAMATPLWRDAQQAIVAAQDQDAWPELLEELRDLSSQAETLLANEKRI